jgi:predicted GNAT family acetyltransferase
MKDFTEKSRFERDVDGAIVYAAYRRRDDVLDITHVEAPPELRGKGEAGKLMEEIMELARENGLKIHPICSYAVAWLNRHQEFNDLLA